MSYIIDKIAELDSEELWESNHADILKEIINHNYSRPIVFAHSRDNILFDCVIADIDQLTGVWLDFFRHTEYIEAIPCVFFIHEDNNSVRVWVRDIDKLLLMENNNTKSKNKNKVVKTEKERELDLYLYLLANGIDCYTQTTTQDRQSRFDIWLPNKCIIELKARSINSNAICQAIKYYETSRLSVILVGESCGQNLIDVIDSFNKIIEKEVISFVPWAYIKDVVVNNYK